MLEIDQPVCGDETFGTKLTQEASAIRVVTLSSQVLVKEIFVDGLVPATSLSTSAAALASMTTEVQIVLGAPEMCAGTV